MTAIHTDESEEERQISNPQQHLQSGSRRTDTTDSAFGNSSILDFVDATSDAGSSFRCITPPAYTASVTDNEVSINAEHIQEEKAQRLDSSYDALNSPIQQRSIHIPPQTSDETLLPTELPAGVPTSPFTSHTQVPPAYLDQRPQEAASTCIQHCGILPSRPAVWLVKRNHIALSSLAATILLRQGILNPRDLVLLSQSHDLLREPNDPFSGIALATYDTVGQVLYGLVEGPVQAAKQAEPFLSRYEEKGTRKAEVRTLPVQVKNNHPVQIPAASLEAVPNAAKEVAISTGKGLGRIVEAGLKAPMTITHAITKGFHNAPKLYGDEVREHGRVTDFQSGLAVSAKSFGYGLADGLSDFFVQPIIGAQREGTLGFAKGVGKGIGNVVCKPAAGAVGLVSYSFLGVYREIQSLKPSNTNTRDLDAAMKAQGEVEYGHVSSQTRTEVVRRWCDVSMRQSGRSNGE